jgi:quinol monooxygenase YgiN
MRAFTWLLLGLAAAAVSVTDLAQADDAILYTVTYVEVMPPSTGQAATLLRQYREASRKDEGNARCEVLQRVDRPNQFVVVAAWKSAKAFEAHGAGAPARDVRGRLQPLQASPNDERLHHALAVGPAPAPEGGGALFVVTHVDVIPPRKDDSLPLLKQLAADSRAEAGNLRFDVVQQVNRPNHFTVVEAWKDRAAFDAHGMTAPTRRFREQLGPMSGALYDERLYALLN